MNVRDALQREIERLLALKGQSAPLPGQALEFVLDSIDVVVLANFIEKTWELDLSKRGFTRLDFETLDSIEALVASRRGSGSV